MTWTDDAVGLMMLEKAKKWCDRNDDEAGL